MTGGMITGVGYLEMENGYITGARTIDIHSEDEDDDGIVSLTAGWSRLSDTDDTMVDTLALNGPSSSDVRISYVAAPNADNDAANKAYVDSKAAAYLPLKGGTMDGDIDMGRASINGIEVLEFYHILFNAVDEENSIEIVSQDGSAIELYSSATDDQTVVITGVGTPSGDNDAANKAYVDVVGDLVGDTSVSEQIATAVANKADKDEVLQIVTATTDDGVAYTVTVPGITAFTTGKRFVLITDTTSTSTTPTLNVNGLGAKNVRRRLSTGATAVAGYSTGWIVKNKPYMFMYDGIQWIIEGQEKPVGLDLYGPIHATHDGAGNLIEDTYMTTECYLEFYMPRVTTISLPADNWTGDSNPWYQTLTVDAATDFVAKIDLQPTAEQIIELQDADIALMAENECGEVTVYALGGKPTTDFEMQILITPVNEV